VIDLLVRAIDPAPHEAEYWRGLKEERLKLQRCDACGQLQHYPRSICRSCLASELSFVDAAGTGTVFSYTVVRRAPLPELRALAPYVLALVELVEGVRVMSTVEADPEDLFIGVDVQVSFRQVGDWTLPTFQLTGPQDIVRYE